MNRGIEERYVVWMHSGKVKEARSALVTLLGEEYEDRVAMKFKGMLDVECKSQEEAEKVLEAMADVQGGE